MVERKKTDPPSGRQALCFVSQWLGQVTAAISKEEVTVLPPGTTWKSTGGVLIGRLRPCQHKVRPQQNTGSSTPGPCTAIFER